MWFFPQETRQSVGDLYYVFTTQKSVTWRHCVFGLSVCLLVRPDRSVYCSISWSAWAILMKLTDDRIRFWRSRSRQAVEMEKLSMLLLGHQSPSSSFCLASVLQVPFEFTVGFWDVTGRTFTLYRKKTAPLNRKGFIWQVQPNMV